MIKGNDMADDAPTSESLTVTGPDSADAGDEVVTDDRMSEEQAILLQRQREEEDRRRTQLLLQQNPQQGLGAFAFLIALFMGMSDDDSLASDESTNSLASALGLDLTQFRSTVADVRSGRTSSYAAASSTLLSRAPSGGISEAQIEAARGAVARYASTGNPLLELIASKESGGNYNIMFGGRTANLTSMTVDQVLAYQRQYVHSGMRSSAAGKYQIISTTLEGLKREMNLSGHEKFDETLQDSMATVLLERRGLSQYLAGRMDERTFMRHVSQEWASMPKDASGRSYYAGDGLNKALIDPATLLAAIRTTREDGGTTTLASAGFPGGVDQTTRRPNAQADGLTTVHTATMTSGGTDQIALAATTDSDHPVIDPVTPGGAKPV